jgi:hypothetical protein
VIRLLSSYNVVFGNNRKNEDYMHKCSLQPGHLSGKRTVPSAGYVSTHALQIFVY